MNPFAALVGCWLLNGCWPLIGQDGIRYFSTPIFFQLALGIGLLAFLPVLSREGRWGRLLSARIGLPLLAMSAISSTASVIYLEALHYTTPANAAVMAQIEVFYSAVLAAVVLKERIGPRQIGASLLIVAGTGLIMAHDLGSLRWKGDLMILATPWLYQISHIIAKRLPKDADPAVVTGGRQFFGLIVMIPFTAWSLAHEPRWSFTPQALAPLLLQGLLMNALSLYLWYQAVLRLDLAKTTGFLLSYPALTMLFSWGLGRETIAPLQVAGLLVTLSGAWWLRRITLAAERPRGPTPEARPLEAEAG